LWKTRQSVRSSDHSGRTGNCEKQASKAQHHDGRVGIDKSKRSPAKSRSTSAYVSRLIVSRLLTTPPCPAYLDMLVKDKERTRRGQGEDKERTRRGQGEDKERTRRGQGEDKERTRRGQGVQDRRRQKEWSHGHETQANLGWPAGRSHAAPGACQTMTENLRANPGNLALTEAEVDSEIRELYPLNHFGTQP